LLGEINMFIGPALAKMPCCRESKIQTGVL
jgi:hypothetical protein